MLGGLVLMIDPAAAPAEVGGALALFKYAFA